jgi:hypothetical protein
VSKLKQGEPGGNGAAAINCYVESSAGTLFLDGTNDITTLTARIYEGSTEIDEDGDLTYRWYLDDSETELQSGNEVFALGSGIYTKGIRVYCKKIANHTIHFTAGTT